MASRIRSKFKENVNFKAEIVSDDTSFAGVVEYLTPDDIHLRTSPEQAFFLLEKEVELTIRLSSDETISLACNATSSHIHNHPTHGLINSVKLKITDPSSEFNDFFSVS